jgi:adenine-specific DNA-methyltransferase
MCLTNANHAFTNHCAQAQKNIKIMTKKYKGSLSLEWFNKQKSIINLNEKDSIYDGDVPAPQINWINKDEALFYEISKEEGRGQTPYWVSRDDIRVKEARPLVFSKAYRAFQQDKQGTLPNTQKEYAIEEITEEAEAKDISNFMIKGDNLLALNTIKKYFNKYSNEDKVKCIYIDPPYNTGSAFEHYDDNLAHSEWLTLMRDRLRILKDLMRDDGVIIVQIDDTELAYLKILMDEIFGRDNFKKIISVKMSTASGVKTTHRDRTILKEKESLVIFAKDNSEVYVKPQYIPKNEWNPEFQFFLQKNGSDNPKDWKVRKLKEILKEKNINRDINSKEFQDFVINNADVIWRRAFIRGEMKEKSLASFDKILTKKLEDGKTHYYYKGREMYFLKNSLHECFTEDGFITSMSYLLCDFWDDINTGRLFNEGNVDFRDGKKPEFLIARLLEMFTEPEDLVLDCFGGSGSTFAVAHKMNRKWIGVEVGNHAESHIIPRMNYVISGSDQSGISKAFKWKGGGAFKYYHLGESIIKVDKETGKGEFNWSLGKQFIQESLLISYDFIINIDNNDNINQLFQYYESKPTYGKIFSKSNKSIYGVAYLSSLDESNDNITNEEIKTIYNNFKKHKDFQSLIIYTNKGVDIAQDAIPEDLDIIKVPYAIFSELEK